MAVDPGRAHAERGGGADVVFEAKCHMEDPARRYVDVSSSIRRKLAGDGL